MRIYKLWNKYCEALDTGKSADAIIFKSKISEQFEKAREDYAIWDQMMQAVDIRRKLVESEVKVVKDIQAIMTAEDAYNMVAELLAAVIEAVNDPQILKRIQYAFTKIVGDTPIGNDNSIDANFVEEE